MFIFFYSWSFFRHQDMTHGFGTQSFLELRINKNLTIFWLKYIAEVSRLATFPSPS